MDPIQILLTRGVEKIYPSKEELEQVLRSGKKLKLYQGFDPTGTRLHLGHTIGLRKLMQFANLGHEVIFLFGTGTVLVGDPSQRDTARKLITQEEIDANIKDWKNQVTPLVDFSRIKIMQNGDWLNKLTLKDIVNISSNISAVQLFKRESFHRRLNSGDTVWYHETMYPLLQGYDSVAMNVDLEIGGTDQEFNMLIGRELMRKMRGKEKYVLTVPMILGIDGQPMSKTTGNCVWLDDAPYDMYGKLMRIPDDQIVPYFKLVTDTSTEKVSAINTNLANHSLHPIDAKKELASAVVSQLHSSAAAQKAQAEFERVVQKHELPSEIQEVTVNEDDGEFIDEDFLVAINLATSKSEAKRLFEQGGVEIDGKRITDSKNGFAIKDNMIIKVGKRKVVRLKTS